MAIPHDPCPGPMPQVISQPIAPPKRARMILGLALLSCALALPCGPACAQGSWLPATKTDRNARRDYVRPVLVAAFDGAFDRLERLATEARQTRATLPGGEPKLSAFYSAFQNYDDWNQQDPENYFPKLFAGLERWRRERPESPTPHVALAALYVDHAWHARGGGWAKEVPEPAWRLFKERLTSAKEVLETAPPAAKKDPHYHALNLILARGLNYALEISGILFDDAQAVDPLYPDIYEHMAIRLLPRWGGYTDRDWVQWLAKALKKPGIPEEDADALYATVSYAAIGYAYSRPDEPNPFSAAGVDWPRLKRGTQVLLRRHPESSSIPARYFRAAFLKRDRASADEALALMKNRFDPWEWGGKSGPEFFALLQALR